MQKSEFFVRNLQLQMTFQEELMMRLDRKLVVLKAEQEAVREEGEVNEALGARVTVRVSAVARPPEASKYRLHVEEVGKITSLLLGLSGRLARAENALYGMPADHTERVSITINLPQFFRYTLDANRFLQLLYRQKWATLVIPAIMEILWIIVRLFEVINNYF